MIEQELLLLGLLRQGPKHGYDIKTKVKQILSLFAGIQAKSIYYPLRVLEQKGLIAKKIGKVGNRPKRIVYTLTAKGKTRFEELLGRSLLELKRPQFSLDLSLYFLHYLKPISARNRLRARLRMLNRISLSMKKLGNLKKNKGHSSLSRILEHNTQMLTAEAKFLFTLIKTL
ncbi:MAG: PadR family transcriptional regulator [Candidatus Omnitrophica bacterium]|jgi:DNA-binding PadR family transcriptional regulator|nr:PadR family transcriptional regulator [Candidatus Omnitrophota bacterium]MDD3987334.1 PadR family transcriptional regulator [Candidatus Omnitrophota bacterium]MDD4981621.1 PadR family transcriptional regulator [Candidatus Omnitrophota bacterium]MDD5665072.1 PadR family transcriptional regulator [Candidatus Omnitrophota bacterium]